MVFGKHIPRKSIQYSKLSTGWGNVLMIISHIFHVTKPINCFFLPSFPIDDIIRRLDWKRAGRRIVPRRNGRFACSQSEVGVTKVPSSRRKSSIYDNGSGWNSWKEILFGRNEARWTGIDAALSRWRRKSILELWQHGMWLCSCYFCPFSLVCELNELIANKIKQTSISNSRDDKFFDLWFVVTFVLCRLIWSIIISKAKIV